MASYCEIAITETKITTINSSIIPVICDRHYTFFELLSVAVQISEHNKMFHQIVANVTDKKLLASD